MRGAVVLFLVGCVAPVGGVDTDVERAEDRLAVDALRATWYAHGRGYPDCPAADNDLVVREFDSQDALTRWCGWTTPVRACRYGGEIGILRSYVPAVRASAIIHETLHPLRACWVIESGVFDVERFDTGQSERCAIDRADDPNHCDTEAWQRIAGEALVLWGERQ